MLRTRRGGRRRAARLCEAAVRRTGLSWSRCSHRAPVGASEDEFCKGGRALGGAGRDSPSRRPRFGVEAARFGCRAAPAFRRGWRRLARSPIAVCCEQRKGRRQRRSLERSETAVRGRRHEIEFWAGTIATFRSPSSAVPLGTPTGVLHSLKGGRKAELSPRGRAAEKLRPQGCASLRHLRWGSVPNGTRKLGFAR